MARVFFNYCLRDREAKLFHAIMFATLVMAIPLGMFTLMLGSAFIIGYPDEEFVKLFLGITGALTGFSTIYLISSLKYKETSRVEVHEDGLLLGNRRFVRWSEIDDMKFLTETRVDLEVEGGPVMGYGMHGYGMYGYASSRSVTRHVYRYVDVQLFHRGGVDEMRFTPREFSRYVKAILQAIENKQELLAGRNWPQKLMKLDEAS